MEFQTEKNLQNAHVKNIICFKFLSDPEIVDLLAISDVLLYSQEEPLVEEGEISPYFFGILDGTVSISVRETEGKQVYVNSLGPGDVFGEAGIFMNVKRTATVSSLGDTLILRIHRNELGKFIKRNAEAGNKILLVIIFSLLRKLNTVNQELAYERKSDIAQDEIDSMVDNLFCEK